MATMCAARYAARHTLGYAMREFGYQKAADVPDAVALLGADAQARFLGGGTNLVARE